MIKSSGSRAAALVAALALAGCSDGTVDAAKRAVESRLKDPGSVQYRSVEAFSEGVVCGEFNAKNGLGGYVGFQPFVFNGPEMGELTAKADREEIQAFCKDGGGKRLAFLEAKLATAKKHRAYLEARSDPANCKPDPREFKTCEMKVADAKDLLRLSANSVPRAEAAVTQERERAGKARP